MGKKTVDSRYQAANRLLGGHTGTSKGKAPVTVKTKVRPTGGLKPKGVKGTITVTW